MMPTRATAQHSKSWPPPTKPPERSPRSTAGIYNIVDDGDRSATPAHARNWAGSPRRYGALVACGAMTDLQRRGTDLGDARSLPRPPRARDDLRHSSLRWPGAKAHDYFAAVKTGKSYVSLYLLVADTFPEALEGASPSC